MIAPLEKHVHALTERVFGRHHNILGTLLSRWPEVVGGEYSAITRPFKISLLHNKANGEEELAKLVLMVKPAKMLSVQHASSEIIERVNVFHGYSIIKSLRLTPDASNEILNAKNKAPLRPTPEVERLAFEIVKPVSNLPLQAALLRLGMNVIVAHQAK